MNFSFKRILILLAVFIPLDFVFAQLVDRKITIGSMINLVIIVLIIDILFVLSERKKK